MSDKSSDLNLVVTNADIRALRKVGERVYYVTLSDGTTATIILNFER